MISGSPRPSINTAYTLIDPIRPTMQPVAEEVCLIRDSDLVSCDEVDRVEIVEIVECQPPSDIKPAIVPEKLMKEKTCTERNDSGFSDCSVNSSVNVTQNLPAPSNVPPLYPLLSDVNSITEGKIIDRDQNKGSITVGEKSIDMGANVSVNFLKQKLEKFAEFDEINTKKNIPNRNVPKKVSRPASANPILAGKIEVEQKQDLNRSKSIPPMEFSRKIESTGVDPTAQIPNLNQKAHEQTAAISPTGLDDRINPNGQIMRSDFTNTVKMRKKSLELSVQREKHLTSPRLLLEPLGKVTKLLQRFDAQNQCQAPSSSPSPSISTVIIDELQDENEFPEARDQFGRDESDDVIIISEEIPITPITPPASLIPKSIPFVEKPKIPVKSTKSTANFDSGLKNKQFVNARQKTITTNTKPNVNAFQSKIRYTNTATVEINRIATKSMTIVQTKTNNTKSLKNVQKSKIAEAAEHHYKQQITTNTTGSQQIKNVGIGSPKSTVYASFNRTSPVRLSGRVKEVTDRLSTPKGYAKRTTTSNSNATSKKTLQSVEQRECFAIETTIDNKTNSEFTLRSKMNESFRKANAFWKAT